MKPHFTTGPWICDRNGCGELAVFTRRGRHTLSGEGNKPLPLSQREANGELQAAAPEMYQALQAVRSHLIDADVLFDPNPQWEGEQARYDRAQAALCLVDRVLGELEAKL